MKPVEPEERSEIGKEHNREDVPLEVALDAMIALIESLTRPTSVSGAAQAHVAADDLV
jgi:hypothetical protein